MFSLVFTIIVLGGIVIGLLQGLGSFFAPITGFIWFFGEKIVAKVKSAIQNKRTK